MQVLAFAQEESPNTIRKGIIDNIDKTTQALTRVVAKLSDKLGVRVNSVYVMWRFSLWVQRAGWRCSVYLLPDTK